MKINLIKDNSEDEYNSVSWSRDGNDVLLSFPFEINAIFSEKIERVIVEKYEVGKVGIYFLSGDMATEIDIPEMSGYQFRGINRNSESSSGASFLFFPTAPDKGNQWKDIEQYELCLNDNPLGKYLNIYR